MNKCLIGYTPPITCPRCNTKVSDLLGELKPILFNNKQLYLYDDITCPCCELHIDKFCILSILRAWKLSDAFDKIKSAYDKELVYSSKLDTKLKKMQQCNIKTLPDVINDLANEMKKSV